MRTLTLAFACIGTRAEALIQHLNKLKFPVGVEALIIMQKPNQDSQTTLEASSYKFKILETIGLSKSRNAAIELSNTDFAWFLDDDVQLTNQDLVTVVKIINENTENFFKVRIGCIEWQDKTFKPYKDLTTFKKLNILQVSSIELIADLNFIKTKNIKFNENIGLGTSYKACEENNFLIDAWNSGGRFKFINQVLVRHTCIFENRILANDEIFEIRGATASRYGMVGFLLLLRWLIRYAIKEKRMSYLIALTKGYFKGYNQFLK